MKKVLVIDTSILCVWLGIPGFETCGPQDDRWDKKRVDSTINHETANKSLFVLPLATIIETGNHIAKAPHSRKVRAEALVNLLRMTADGRTPWAALSEQDRLWSRDSLLELSREWPMLAERKLSIGDAMIKNAANYYAAMGCTVEIFTGDLDLKSFEPAEQPAEIPRRRQ